MKPEIALAAILGAIMLIGIVAEFIGWLIAEQEESK